MEAMMATASVEKGQAAAKQCQACHTFEKGGPNRVGPNLWGIVGRPRASEAGFNYSAAMKAKGGTWTFGELYAFLANPRGYIAGTNMTFAGLARDQQRADVIDFLNTLSDNPQPLPKAAAAAPAAKACRSAEEVDKHGGISETRPGQARPFCLECGARPLVADRKTDIITRDCMMTRGSTRRSLCYEVDPTFRFMPQRPRPRLPRRRWARLAPASLRA